MRRCTDTFLKVIIILAWTCFVSCSTAKNSVSDNTYVVDCVIDLKGDTLLLPVNGTIVFKSGGCLKNGTIVGQNTQIKTDITSFFDHVHIEGEWNVPKISCDFFRNINDDDILKEVFSLISDKVQNTVTLEKRDYWVTATTTNKHALVLKSNTVLHNSGTIRMRPNNLISYSIVAISGSNIKVNGGFYLGERMQHVGTTGEWGHGICITNGSDNVTVRNVNVCDCWGDGIAVDGNEVNTNIIISGFVIDNCRRQGISVIFADRCTISKGVITNIQGTEPHLGIDIEPNSNGYCHNLKVENVTIESEKGLGIFTATKDFQINSVTISNCEINATDFSAIYAARCDGLIIKNNTLSSSASGNNPVVSINSGVRNSQLLCNTINYKGDSKSNCCVYNSGANTLIHSNIISSSVGVAFYTNAALIKRNTISAPEFMTSADNATDNFIQANKVRGNLTCAARGNVFENNVFFGDVILNGNECVFENNEVRCNTVSGTPVNGHFSNNKVVAKELFELNGNVIINSNDIQAPKVILKTGTTTSNNIIVQTKENDTEAFITLYGNLFEGNFVRTNIKKGSRNNTYVYCTSDGTTISNNVFKSAPSIKYWLYSSKNIQLNNNRSPKKMSFEVGAQTKVK